MRPSTFVKLSLFKIQYTEFQMNIVSFEIQCTGDKTMNKTPSTWSMEEKKVNFHLLK